MSLLFDAVYRNECRSTHHKLALDALRHLRGKQADNWMRLFVRYYEDYLEGAKAPDKQFRDFRNHVLHVSDNYWGGAVKASVKWYDRAVESFNKKDWVEGVYCAGVLSHYYTDPLMPFHTGQSEEEGVVHRAFEWSVCKSYDQVLPLVKEYPDWETPSGDEWLGQMVRQGAEAAHQHYRVFIDQYDLEVGARRPAEALNDELRERLSGLFAHAIIGMSRILERIFQDAQVKPPAVRIGLMGTLTKLTAVFGKLGGRRASSADRKAVRRILKEYRRTGCVIDSLPADERQVRKEHAEEVLGISEENLNELTRQAARQQRESAAANKADQSKADPSKADPSKADPSKQRQDKERQSKQRQDKDRQEPSESKTVQRPAGPVRAPQSDRPAPALPVAAPNTDPPPATVADDLGPATVKITAASTGQTSKPLTFHLNRQSPVVDGPSVGSKTARRLAKVGVHTVDDLLAMDVEQAAEELNSNYMTAQTLRNWQSQAALCCRVPNLRGHDAQMLVGCGITDPQLIANMAPGELLDRVENFLISEEGERILSRAKEPDRDEVTNWIRWCQQARKLAAA